MYVTRPLSQFKKSPITLSEEPPEGPFSGVLVITDEEAEAEDMYCFGICKRTRVEKLPFPQDKILSVVHTDSLGYRESLISKVLFIPVLDQPLSSNRYYVIRAKGKYKGCACVCSRETDEVCCFPGILQDKNPKPLNPRNIYQTIKIKRHHRHTFFAKSIAPDGIPPSFLKNKGWEIKDSKSLFPLKLKDALGLDEDLRTRLPDFNFPVSTKRSSAVVIGEWYCPFMFIKEPYRARYQMKKSIFYKMTLTQHWEQIFYCENTNVNSVNGRNNNDNNTDTVKVDANVGEEVNYVLGMEARKDEKSRHEGFYWYRVIPSSRYQRSGNLRKKANSGLGLGLGLSFVVVEKMRRVVEEGGWVGGGERMVKIEEEIRISDDNNNNNDNNSNNNSSNSNSNNNNNSNNNSNSNGNSNGNNGGRSNNRWGKFACYMLVESFRLRRMDGTLLLKCVFRHTHRVRCKWE